MKTLFLHGWGSTAGALKPTSVRDHGKEVLNLALPKDDFKEAVKIAQAEYDRGPAKGVDFQGQRLWNKYGKHRIGRAL